MATTSTRDITITALLIAVVFICTSYIRVTLVPGMGLVHMGSAALFAASVLFGKHKGAIAGSVGMALFNITSEWIIWAPFTFVIRYVMGYVIGSISHLGGANGRSFWLNILAGLVATLWFIPSTYLAGVVIFGSWAAPIAAITSNLLQALLMYAVGLPIAMVLGRLRTTRA